MMMSMEQPVEWELARETEVLGENLPSATLSTTYPTWPDLGSNPSHRGGKPATNLLSYDTAINNLPNWMTPVGKFRSYIMHLKGKAIRVTGRESQ
jgi:hypothetical protein